MYKESSALVCISKSNHRVNRVCLATKVQLGDRELGVYLDPLGLADTMAGKAPK